MTQANVLNWFEIFVNDLKRAQGFYEKVLDTKLKFEDFDGMPNCMFLIGEDAFGALVKSPHRKPSADGALTYFNCNGKLDACLARVEAAGGKVVMPKRDIGPPGFIALVADTEGNVIGLHTER